MFSGCNSSAARSAYGALLEGLGEAVVRAKRLHFNQILVLSSSKHLVQLFNKGGIPSWKEKTLVVDILSLKHQGLSFSFLWVPSFVLGNVNILADVASSVPIHDNWSQPSIV